MKNVGRAILLLLLAGCMCAAAAHKFYAAVFTIEHAPEKKVLQMTARIFVDDLELAFKRKYGRNFYLGSKSEAPDAKEYLAKYLSEKILFQVNGSAAPLKLLGREIEDDLIICYCTIPAPGAVNSINISNKLLMDTYPEQQNIVHATLSRNKKSLLLTNDNATGTIQF